MRSYEGHYLDEDVPHPSPLLCPPDAIHHLLIGDAEHQHVAHCGKQQLIAELWGFDCKGDKPTPDGIRRFAPVPRHVLQRRDSDALGHGPPPPSPYCEANPDNTAPAGRSVSIPLGFEVLAHLSAADELRQNPVVSIAPANAAGHDR